MKLIIQILLIFLVVSTVAICAIKPDLHKNVVVYDSAYTLVSEEEVKTETKEIPVMEKPIVQTPVNKVVETKVIPAQTTTKRQNNITKKQTVVAPKQIITTNQNKTETKVKTETKPQTTVVKNDVIKQEIKKTEIPKVEKRVVEKPVAQPKVLTQQEEAIAWNKWRSTLTNQIMQDTKLPSLPNGVLFQFSFTVDKFGKISSVQTGADPANYTPYAIQYIAPVIRSYQGRSILNFPEGTARTSTQVTGKWRLSSTEKYSTPQDYNDIEKVMH